MISIARLILRLGAAVCGLGTLALVPWALRVHSLPLLYFHFVWMSLSLWASVAAFVVASRLKAPRVQPTQHKQRIRLTQDELDAMRQGSTAPRWPDYGPWKPQRKP